MVLFGDDMVFRSFVKSQVYRPLFFKHDNFVDFTTDASQYSCETEKTFFDHNGVEKPLAFVEGTWPSSPQVDMVLSGISGIEGVYGIEDVQYSKQTNTLEYKISYNPVEIRNNRFLCNDIEFYVVRVGGGDRVSCLYFNEFQKDMQSEAKKAVVEGNHFTLNGKTYELELDESGNAIRLSIDGATEVFSEDEKEFKCEIVNDRFKVDGVWYSLERENGAYSGLSYAGVDDYRLSQIPISSDGFGEYRKLGLAFKFQNSTLGVDWNSISVVQNFQCSVVDRIKSETCAFDGVGFTIDEEDRSFKWNLLCVLRNLWNNGPHQCKDGITRLGNGCLYLGGVQDIACELDVNHEIQDGNVLTKGILKINGQSGDGGETFDMGVLYDRVMDPQSGRISIGTLDLDGLVQKNPSGDMAFVLKDPGQGWNCTNAVWMPVTTWNTFKPIIQNVGTLSIDDETNEISTQLTGDDVPDQMRLSPQYEYDENGGQTGVISGYVVESGVNGVGSYFVNRIENDIHVVAKGSESGNSTRYILHLDTNSVDRVLFRPVPVSTVVFEPQTSIEQMKDGLATNVKQMVLTKLVQQMIDCSSESPNPIHICPSSTKPPYLDMFTNEKSLESYRVASGTQDSNSPQCQKFAQIYANNLEEIDSRNMHAGNIYRPFIDRISGVFGEGNSIELVDGTSVSVQRIEEKDVFTYEFLFDLHLMQNKELMKKLQQNQDFREKFLP